MRVPQDAKEIVHFLIRLCRYSGINERAFMAFLNKFIRTPALERSYIVHEISRPPCRRIENLRDPRFRLYY